MQDSKRIAGLVGPTLVAMLLSEYPLVQPHLYDAQIPPVVYLFGASAYQRGAARTSTAAFMVVEGLLLVAGLIMTFKAYSRGKT